MPKHLRIAAAALAIAVAAAASMLHAVERRSSALPQPEVAYGPSLDPYGGAVTPA